MHVRLPRSSKGKRPTFFPDEPAADRLLTMVMALATDVAALRERLDTVECLAEQKGLVLGEEIESYEPSIEDRERREAWRQAFMDRLLQVLADEVAAGGAQPRPPGPPPGAKGPPQG